jgi:osmotically inducible protein OsmC
VNKTDNQLKETIAQELGHALNVNAAQIGVSVDKEGVSLLGMENCMKRSANAVWDGTLKNGHGELTTQSGVLRNAPYSFATRFGSQPGMNPEELLAAAHAACFSMSLSNELEISKLSATRLETKASVRTDLADGKWTIQEVDLFLKANLGGAPSIPFLVAATRAKANCPVSRVFSARVFLHTELEGQHPGSDLEAEVVIYTSSYCQVCGQAKMLLESKGIRYREVELDLDPTDIAGRLKQKTGQMSVPQIFAGEHYIGSYHDLLQLDADHGLKALLQPNGNSRVVPLDSICKQDRDNSMKVSI